MPGRWAGEGLAPEGLLCWAPLDPKVQVAHLGGSHPVEVPASEATKVWA